MTRSPSLTNIFLIVPIGTIDTTSGSLRTSPSPRQERVSTRRIGRVEVTGNGRCSLRSSEP